MTDPAKTHVDVTELEKYGTGAHDRAGGTSAAATSVAGVHLGTDMLGFFNAAFVDGAREDQATVVARLREMTTALTEDGDAARDSAASFRDNETAQTHRFTDGEMP